MGPFAILDYLGEAMRLFVSVLLAIVTAGCVSFPPQFLDEQKLQGANLRDSKLLVAINPQFQICRNGPKHVCANPLSHKQFPLYEKLGSLVQQRLTPASVRAITDVYDADLFSANEIVAREKPDWILRMQQERASSTGSQIGAITWLVTLGKPAHGALTSSGATRETVVYRFRYSALGSYCLGTYLIDVARPAGDACMEKQADIIVGRLKANGFLE